MNMMFVLFGMCLFSAIVSIFVAITNQRERRDLRRRSDDPWSPSPTPSSTHSVAHKPITHWHGRQTTFRAMFLAVLSLSCAWATSQAQEIVHGVTGTVTAANPAARTFTLLANDGSIVLFQAGTPNATVSLSREMLQQSIAADTFHTVGANVLVFYYGNDAVRTAVAIRDLGTGNLEKVNGSVVDFDRHQHRMKVKCPATDSQDIVLSSETIVDTPMGVVDGLKYKPNKGERVGIVSSGSRGEHTALFISATGPNASLS